VDTSSPASSTMETPKRWQYGYLCTSGDINVPELDINCRTTRFNQEYQTKDIEIRLEDATEPPRHVQHLRS
jgi:hypothetical protein